MLDTVDFNHVRHISFTQSRLTDAVSVILSELLSYEHPSMGRELSLVLKFSVVQYAAAEEDGEEGQQGVGGGEGQEPDRLCGHICA